MAVGVDCSEHQGLAKSSVREEIHFVEPDVIGFLLVVTVHLKRDIDFFLIPVWLRGVININWILLIPDTDADVVHLIADTFQIPDQMDPSVRWKVIAWD